MNITSHFMPSGKATRSQYWGTQLIILLLFVVGVVLASVGIAGVSEIFDSEVLSMIFGILTILPLICITLWVNLVVAIKRCRDIGINPWWVASMYIPYVGIVPWLVLGICKTNNVP